MRVVAILGAVALATVGASAQQKGADEAAIAKLRAAYQTAAGAQDAAGIARLFAADGVEMPPNAPAASGRAAIEAFHKGFAKQWMMHGMTITPTATRVMGDTAYDIGTYKQQIMSNATGIPAIFWTVLWIAFALGILWFAMRLYVSRRESSYQPDLPFEDTPPMV